MHRFHEGFVVAPARVDKASFVLTKVFFNQSHRLPQTIPADLDLFVREASPVSAMGGHFETLVNGFHLIGAQVFDLEPAFGSLWHK